MLSEKLRQLAQGDQPQTLDALFQNSSEKFKKMVK